MHFPMFVLVFATARLAVTAVGSVRVRAADVSGASDGEAKKPQAPLWRHVVSSNRPRMAITDGEWALIPGRVGRLVQERLEFSVEDHDARVCQTVPAQIDGPGTRGRKVPNGKARPSC